MNPLIINITKITETVGLAKYAPDEMRQKTFQEIYEFMMDEKADNINKGYNSIEKRTSQQMKEDYESFKNSKTILIMQYISQPDFKNITVNLEDKVCDKSGILHKRADVIEGDSTPFDEIQLKYSVIGKGGNNDISKRIC